MYSRRIGATVHSFGHEGVLYRESFIMYDLQTDSLWVHTTGEAIRGAMKGKVLTFLPSVVTTWKRWRGLYPHTTVLTGERADSFMGRFGLRERPADYGLSLGQGTAPKLYPLELLMKARVVNDEHEGRAVAVLYDEQSGTARAYGRGERVFAWRAGRLVDETGAAWDLMRGVRTDDGTMRLEALPATTWLIERWKGFYPRAPVYAAR